MGAKKTVINPKVANLNPLDIVGWTIGDVTILEHLGLKTHNRRKANGTLEPFKAHTYKCKCACGAVFEKRRELILPRRFKNVWNCGNFKIHKKMASPKLEDCFEPNLTDGKPCLIEDLKAKVYCKAPDDVCYRSEFLHLCCCECDKKGTCKMACLNEPNKCRSWRPRNGRE